MDLVAIDPSDEEFLLDLLNTTPVVDGIVHDGLADSAAAKAWMREHGVAPTNEEAAALLDARSVLQKVVRGEAGPKALKRFVEDIRLRPVVRWRRIGLATGRRWWCHRRGQGGAGVGRPADIQSRPAAAVCELRMPAVPHRSQQAQHSEVVFDGHLRQSDEGPQALPPRPHGRGMTNRRTTAWR